MLVSGVLAASALLALLGLSFFRRSCARRVIAYADQPEVELAYGPLWLVIAHSAALAVRHPRLLGFGLDHAVHLLAGVDSLSLLDDDEISWVDAYHARVRETIGALVDEETAAWLNEATQPLRG